MCRRQYQICLPCIDVSKIKVNQSPVKIRACEWQTASWCRPLSSHRTLAVCCLRSKSFRGREKMVHSETARDAINFQHQPDGREPPLKVDQAPTEASIRDPRRDGDSL